MNAKTKTILTDLAKKAGLSLEITDGEPIRLSGFEHGDATFFLFDLKEPDSELIFNILQKIGMVPVREKELKMPWIINRPYENERLGEAAYKTRRTIRHSLNSEWRSGLWAMCVYIQLGCPNEFKEFLNRHPEKMKLMPLIALAILKARFIRIISSPFRIFFRSVHC